MRGLVLFFSLFVFTAELTLDGSTAFVRESFTVYALDASSQAQRTAGPSKESTSGPRIVIEGHSHSALPERIAEASVWAVEKSEPLNSDIIIPLLEPPRARIERPPIC